MNRIEFIAELERLLQDISAEERQEAVQYYRDYFEDAGMENEQHIIAELESPEKVAATIKAGLRGGDGESSKYRETGYTDTRFGERETPTRHQADGSSYGNGSGQEKKPWNSNLLKILLIIAIVIVGAPIVLPLAIAFLCVILGLVLGAVALLAGIVIAAVVITITGVIMAIAGIVEAFSFPTLGLTICGIGLIMGVIGLVATVLLVKLCMFVFPRMFRGIVNLCRRPIHGKGGQ